jgi:nucleotide-binding universal stress UspA family protein
MTTDTAARCIVVGYDAQAPSERALSWALTRAGATGRVVVVHAARRQPDRLRPGLPLPSARERLAHAHATVELPFLERRDVYDVGTCEYEVRDESPADALVTVATEVGADEIVVGSRRQERLRSITGSVSSDLVHRAPCPLVVVP